MKRSEVYREARLIMIERGMAKRKLLLSNGRVCINGACNIAEFGVAIPTFNDLTWDNYSHDAALGEAATALGLDEVLTDTERRDFVPATLTGVMINDAKNTTLNHMLDVLERAEKLALIDEEGY